MRLTLCVLLLFAILASGCTRGPVNPYEPDVAGNRGVARIIVQDNHNHRVVNATVLVTPAGASGPTDDQGIYMAEDLAPGNATAYVSIKCYSDAHTSFVVNPGKVREVVLFVDKLC